MLNSQIIIQSEKLSLEVAQQFAMADNVGGVVDFIGTVRNHTKGETVLKLDFEAYEPMAVKEMQKIADKALEQFDIHRIAIHHRVGELSVGEVPVIIVASAAHRVAAFEACQFAIDTLKQTVPIWKKEYFENGEVWVSAFP